MKIPCQYLSVPQHKEVEGGVEIEWKDDFTRAGYILHWGVTCEVTNYGVASWTIAIVQDAVTGQIEELLPRYVRVMAK